MVTKSKIKKQLHAFLKEHTLAVVATASPDGVPQAATMYYIIDDDLVFYLITFEESHKFKNIQQNPNVAIVVGAGPDLITLQARGKAEIIGESLLGAMWRKKIMIQLVGKVAFSGFDRWPLLKIKGGRFVTIKVQPTWMTWLVLDKKKYPDMYRDDFHQILP